MFGCLVMLQQFCLTNEHDDSIEYVCCEVHTVIHFHTVLNQLATEWWNMHVDSNGALLDEILPGGRLEVHDALRQSLYKAMNVERQHRIFIEQWSDSIHIALCWNDGFLHSFHDFWKSNAFRENLIRTEFILQKIFFRMSILSSSKALWMFFKLH